MPKLNVTTRSFWVSRASSVCAVLAHARVLTHPMAVCGLVPRAVSRRVHKGRDDECEYCNPSEPGERKHSGEDAAWLELRAERWKIWPDMLYESEWVWFQTFTELFMLTVEMDAPTSHRMNKTRRPRSSCQTFDRYRYSLRPWIICTLRYHRGLNQCLDLSYVDGMIRELTPTVPKSSPI